MKRKFIALLLASCMTLSVATACEKGASYDDVYAEVEKDIKKEYKKELSAELEEDLRDEIAEELEAELREQIEEEYAAELELEIENATAGLRDSVEEELRPAIEAEIRAELEEEYETKLQEAIAEYAASNPAGGEGGEGGEGGNAPSGEAGYVEAEVDFDINNFEFDTKHMVVNGTGLTFGVTKCKNLPDDFYGYMSKDERATYYLNANRVTWITCQIANHTGESNYQTYEGCYISFVNLDYDGPLLLSDCVLYEVQIASKATKAKILTDDGITFDLGSGLTETSTYEDFVAVLGEPSSDYTYEYDDGTSTTKYTFGSTMMKGWSVEVTFVNGKGICELDFTGYVYAE
ncbi:MAG: hypothetical protein MJ172_09975 [Clostridia bacterium]|nr:hypothetical protein [Clostridia bacterium]